MDSPIQTPVEARTQATFRSLLYAMSYPGRAYPLTGGLEAVAETLLDLETSYYLAGDPPASSEFLRRTGARFLPPAQAHYHFYSQLTEAELDILKQAPVGTMLFPDEGATLVISARLGEGVGLRLSGPGLPKPTEILVGGLPPGFWEARVEAIRFPLGWDVFLVGESEVIGLPRTTHVEVI